MEKISNCKICLTPSTRPRVKFKNNFICNACEYQKLKKEINWSERKEELKEICKKYKSKDGSYDCIVPWSGGKDSSYIAYKMDM